MNIMDYNKNLDKKKIAESAYKICGNAKFPVEYQDVYNHLFESNHLILKLLLNDEKNLVGFGVFENYELFLERKITMLYLSGMVIDPNYQKKNIAKGMIRKTYQQIQSDLISLRTQNIAMAKSLLNTFEDNLLAIPKDQSTTIVEEVLKQTTPFKNIDKRGVIKNCYPNQLYENLKAIEENFDIKLEKTDALGVIIEPRKNQKVLSLFKENTRLTIKSQ